MLDLPTLHRRASKVLPEVIQTSGVVQAAHDPHALAALLFPLRRKSSGSLRFQLSSATLKAMATDPLTYLEQATQARQGLGRRQAPFTYRHWRKALIPGMAISHTGNERKCTGSCVVYFTSKSDGKALLLVIPDLRLAVYLWNDHDAAGHDALTRYMD
jgi:hypothetical protein